MSAWREENLRAYTDRLGKWISWSYQSDSLGEFFNLIICIDTNEYDTIRESMKILYKGVQKEISFVEVLNMEYLKDKILPMELPELDSCVIAQPSNPVKDNSDVHKQDSGEISKVVKNSENEVIQKIDKNQNTAEQAPHPSSPVLGNETDIFKDYRFKSARSEVCSEGSVKGDENLRSEVCITDNSHSSQSTLCIGIDKKLKVKSNRGRPGKAKATIRNPFDIGGKYKFKRARGGKPKIPQKIGRRNAKDKCLQIVPVNVVGSSV